MRILFVFITVFVLLVSCGEKVVEAPENLISEEQMASILYDLAILNSTKGASPNILRENNIELMPFIFKKYKIDSLQFAQSDVYYASIPLKYQTIYETLEERLINEVEIFEEERKQKNDSSRKALESRRDSLKTPEKTRVNDSLSKK